MEQLIFRAAVIGGGAAGLTAAIGWSRQLGKGQVILLEKQHKTGRKLLATGNGRCNISNEGVSPAHYHGDEKIIYSVLSHFSVSDMKDFFHFDEEHMTLTGEKSHVKYSIGERVVVKVLRASKEEKMIDFEVVKKVE